MADLDTVVGAGSLRSTAVEAVSFPHRWTDGGVTVEAAFTGAHLLHLAVAGCVLNDVYREAEQLGIPVDGVRVIAGGRFDTGSWASTGISYTVDVDSPAPPADVERLLATVDAVAEIPKAVRAGAPVGYRPAEPGCASPLGDPYSCADACPEQLSEQRHTSPSGRREPAAIRT